MSVRIRSRNHGLYDDPKMDDLADHFSLDRTSDDVARTLGKLIDMLLRRGVISLSDVEEICDRDVEVIEEDKLERRVYTVKNRKPERMDTGLNEFLTEVLGPPPKMELDFADFASSTDLATDELLVIDWGYGADFSLKIDIIKELRVELGIGLKEAKDLVEAETPVVLKPGITSRRGAFPHKSHMPSLADALRRLGVELRENEE